MALIIVGGFACWAAACFSLMSRKKDRNVEILESALRVNQLRDLSLLMDLEQLPMVVSISGRVVSETPIECRISGLRGVIVQKSVEEHYLKKVDIEQKTKCKCGINKHEDIGQKKDAESWTQHSALISSKFKEVPWYLDDGTDRVHVVGARRATGFVLPVGSSTFEASGELLERNSKRKKIIGIKKIERVLPVGTSLTVVGEACKDDDGAVRIQRVPKGQLYVSLKTIDEQIEDFVNDARLWDFTRYAVAVIGTFILATAAIGCMAGGGCSEVVNCEKVSQVAE